MEDYITNFESFIKNLCEKNPVANNDVQDSAINSIKNREQYLKELLRVEEFIESMFKLMKKRIEQVHQQQKEDIDKFDNLIKELKKHNSIICGKLNDLHEDLNNSSEKNDKTAPNAENKPKQEQQPANLAHETKKTLFGTATIYETEGVFSDTICGFGSNLHRIGEAKSINLVENTELYGVHCSEISRFEKNLQNPQTNSLEILRFEKNLQNPQTNSLEILRFEKNLQNPQTNSLEILQSSQNNLLKNLQSSQNNLLKNSQSSSTKISQSDQKELQCVSNFNGVNLFSPLSENFEETWKEVRHKKNKKKGLYSADEISDLQYVKIAGDHGVRAIVCDTWPNSNEMIEGQMYYVNKSKHFIIKLCGILLHGNIGEIYTNERNPFKIKDCKFGENCNNENCEYYHDPLYSPNKSDIRNYIAGSFLYSPQNSEFKTKGVGSLKFGSKSALESDFKRMNSNDIRLLRDQTMHFLLCCLLLH